MRGPWEIELGLISWTTVSDNVWLLFVLVIIHNVSFSFTLILDELESVPVTPVFATQLSFAPNDSSYTHSPPERGTGMLYFILGKNNNFV